MRRSVEREQRTSSQHNLLGRQDHGGVREVGFKAHDGSAINRGSRRGKEEEGKMEASHVSLSIRSTKDSREPTHRLTTSPLPLNPPQPPSPPELMMIPFPRVIRTRSCAVESVV